MNEAKLIEGCLRDKRRAQNELYKYLYSPLMAICMRYKHDQDEAVASLNMGYLKILKGLGKYDQTKDLKKWCSRIMVNHLIDEYRSKSSKERHGQTVFDDTIENRDYNIDLNQVETEIEADALRQMLQQLSPLTNQVFNLYVIDGYSHQEIAKELSMAPGTSRWHLAEARKKLQALFKNTYQDHSQTKEREKLEKVVD